MTYDQLPEDPNGAFLFCSFCQTRSSATRGDYFAADPNETIRCGSPLTDLDTECQCTLTLVREETRLVLVKVNP